MSFLLAMAWSTWAIAAAPAGSPSAAAPAAPNVVIVLLDDVGFGQPTPYGGPVHMPTAEALAAEGLRYTQFHTTALCSPTRAALLTGRNHHAVGFGSVAEFSSAAPGYNALLPGTAATVAEVLRDHGYSTAAFGKWHLTPEYETSAMGPFTRWPTGKGFDYFYGFLGGDTNQFHPAVYENTVAVEPPRAPGYHFMSDMTDHAISWLRQQRSLTPARPFLIYFAPGAAHSPHQAPPEWLDRYRGRFDGGWDALRRETFARQQSLGIVPPGTRLTPRPGGLPAWQSLSPEERRFASRMMEVFAGYLEYADTEVGRLLATLEQTGAADDTLVLYVLGDNGASGEGGISGTINESRLTNGVPENVAFNRTFYDRLGGPETLQNYPAGWAWAGSTPFQYAKTVASHFGGTRNGLIVRWPRGFAARRELRTQFHHVVDLAPTVYDVAGITPPVTRAGVTQQSMDGISLRYSFVDGAAATRRTTQYFEMFGNRAIYHDGWMAAAFHGRVPWNLTLQRDFADDPWELYDLRTDFSQSRNLARRYPEKLGALRALFDAEAERNQVLPLAEASAERMNPALRPSLLGFRQALTFYPGTQRLPEGGAPNLKQTSHRIAVDLVARSDRPDGVLLTQGGRFGGFSLFLHDGVPHYAYSYFNEQVTTVAAAVPLSAGAHRLVAEIRYGGAGPAASAEVTLSVDGQTVATGLVPAVMRGRFSLDETFDIGLDTGTSPSPLYEAPATFDGTIERVTLTPLL